MTDTNTETLEMYRGDDFVFLFTFYEEDEVTPIDITDWNFKLTIKIHPELPDEEAAIKVDLRAIDTAFPALGTLHVPLASEETEKLLPITYYYDLQKEFDGIISTVLVGRLRVLSDVTRRVG